MRELDFLAGLIKGGGGGGGASADNFRLNLFGTDRSTSDEAPATVAVVTAAVAKGGDGSSSGAKQQEVEFGAAAGKAGGRRVGNEAYRKMAGLTAEGLQLEDGGAGGGSGAAAGGQDDLLDLLEEAGE